MIKNGSIGTPLSVTFEWVLDTAHGADYFRRWHRDKANSGGLLIHKASHHFDLVNWWLSDLPSRCTPAAGAVLRSGERCRTRMAPHPERGTHEGVHVRGSWTSGTTLGCRRSTSTTSRTTATTVTRTSSVPA